MFRQLSSLAILVAFALLHAGGEMLHYAPWLGFHQHSSCHHPAEANSLGCGGASCAFHQSQGSTHGHHDSAEQPNDNACEASCALCQYYSQTHLISLAAADPIFASPLMSRCVVDDFSKFVDGQLMASARGPPRV